jgi:hypothetical protein
MNRRSILSVSAITVLGLAVMPGSAVSQQKSLKEQIVGTWTFVSVIETKPDGSKFDGVRGLERGLLGRPDLFVGTLTEKLLTFALGRGVEPFDGPAVRQIVREAKADNYRFSAILVGITGSTPFTMRKTP